MPRGEVKMDDIIITKIMRPNAFPVPNPLTVLTAFTETTKIHATNPIATITMMPAYVKTGPIMENSSSSSASDSMICEGSIDVRDPHMRNITAESTIIMGMTGTFA